MVSRSTPRRRLLLAVDIERYSRQRNLQQHESQSTLREATNTAAHATGLVWTPEDFQPTGDGYIVMLPHDTAEEVVVGRYLYELDRILRGHNNSRVPEAKVRIRAAIHIGMVHVDSANGWAGDAVVTVCRLLNAGALRRALALFPATSVAGIVSDGMYRDVVIERYDGIEPERFGRVRVSQPDKRFDQIGWVFVPHHDASVLTEPGEQTQPATAPDGAAPDTGPTRVDGRARIGTVNAPGGAVSAGDHGSATVHYGYPPRIWP